MSTPPPPSWLAEESPPSAIFRAIAAAALAAWSRGATAEAAALVAVGAAAPGSSEYSGRAVGLGVTKLKNPPVGRMELKVLRVASPGLVPSGIS